MDRGQRAEAVRAEQVLARPHPAEKEEIVDVGKAWQKKKAEGGWPAAHWPRNMAAAPPRIEKVIWQQEEGVYGKLTQPFQIGEGMCGPTVMAFGSEEHKRHYLPKLASGEHGASCSPSRPAAPTSQGSERARKRTATTGSSTARRSGPPARIIPTTAF